jgi:hypothetical protein
MDSTKFTNIHISVDKTKKRLFYNEKTVLVVVKDISEEMYRTQLWTHGNPHEFLQQFNVKSYKTITIVKGKKLLLGILKNKPMWSLHPSNC